MFGFTPGEEKVVAGRNILQKCVPRWEYTAPAEDDMDKCPSRRPPSDMPRCALPIMKGVIAA